MIALRLLAVLLLILVNGFFVTSEFAMVSSRRMRIATLAEGGDRRASRLLYYKDHLGEYISATQLGITLASLALGFIGEATIASMLEAPLEGYVSDTMRHIIAVTIAYILITTFHVVLGEQVPKMLGIERAEQVALFTVTPMRLFSGVFRWLIYGLNWAGTQAGRLIGLHGSSEHATNIYTQEEILEIVRHSHQGGEFGAGVPPLINRVFDFHEAEIREAMIPRTEVVGLPITASLAEAEEAFCEHGFSRLPVYREHLDKIVGVLFMKDLMPCLRSVNPQTFRMEEMLHAPLFVPPTARLGSVLQQMQAARTHLACVVDEHGGLEGIVTLEDLLEEIVGEIDDEYDEEAREQIIEEGHGVYLLDGMLAVRDANRRFNLKLPEEGGYTTLAGFLLDKAGRILQPGETVEHEGAVFVVEDVDGHRIRRVRFTPAATEETAAAAAAALAEQAEQTTGREGR